MTGQHLARKVTHVWIHSDVLLSLWVGDEFIVTTVDHPFWEEADRAWERADAVASGDRVRTGRGRGLGLRSDIA
jgi:hypothetical protein